MNPATKAKRTRKSGNDSVSDAARAAAVMDEHGNRQDQAAVNPKEISMLNENTRAKFVLFNISAADRVQDGPVMRGFVEIDGEAAAGEAKPEPLKVNVAAWSKVGRESGSNYLSLKIGNNTAEHPDVYSVGPFFGRLFRQVEHKPNGDKKRYFGFIEDSERVGEDENGRGEYQTHWQLRIHAKPATSNDGKTHYIAGAVMPSQDDRAAQDDDLPF
jgi:hypothetical protein